MFMRINPTKQKPLSDKGGYWIGKLVDGMYFDIQQGIRQVVFIMKLLQIK